MSSQSADSHSTQVGGSYSLEKWSAVFLCQNFMGHKTHAELLEQALAQQNCESASTVRFSAYDYPRITRTLIRMAGARVPIDAVQQRSLDLFATRSMLVQGMLANLASRSVQGRPDLVYVHGHGASNVIYKYDASVPVALSLDGTLIADARMRGWPVSSLDRPAIAMEKRAFERAELIVAFSDWARASLVNDYGIPVEKTTTIRNGVDRVPVSQGDCSKILDTDLPIVGFVGNGFFRKGGDLLLEAHQRYLVEKSHLVIVTTDDVNLGSARNVTLMRNVERSYLLSKVLPRFTLYVHPARVDWSPFSLIEALATGLPIVASSVGSVPEMVLDGVNGYLINPQDSLSLAESILSIIENRTRASDFGRESLIRYSNFYDASFNYAGLVSTLHSISADANA